MVKSPSVIVACLASKALCNPFVSVIFKLLLVIVFCLEFREVFISAVTFAKKVIFVLEISLAVIEPELLLTSILFVENPLNLSDDVGKSLELKTPVSFCGGG